MSNLSGRTTVVVGVRPPAARVLLCAVELCSLHYHSGDDADKAVANAIFADGAAAVVGSGATPELERGERWAWRLLAFRTRA